MVKNLPSNAGDTDPISSWRKKIPHAVEQLSTPATTREKPMHNSKRPHVLQLKPSADKSIFRDRARDLHSGNNAG